MTRAQQHPQYGRAFFAWGLAAVFYFYDNLLQIAPAAMKAELSAAFVQQAEEFGALSAAFLYAYAFTQIPAGLLVDKFGPRLLLTAACSLCALGAFIFGCADTLQVALLGRFLLGIGAGFALVSCMQLIADWFPARQFSFFTGITVTIGYLGSVFSLACISSAVASLGWRMTLQSSGILGLVLTILLWTCVRNRPKSRRAQTPAPSIGLWAGLKQVAKQPQSWLCAIYAALMYAPILAFGGLWGVPFLEEAHGFERSTAGAMVSLVYIGFMCGAPVFGWLSDYVGKRKLPMYIGNIGILIAIVGLLYFSLPIWLIQLALFSLGFFSSGFIVSFTLVRELNSPAIAGTAVGFMNFINTLLGAILQHAIGYLLDNITTGYTATFSLAEYRLAFMVLPISLVLSLLLSLPVCETYCRQSK